MFREWSIKSQLMMAIIVALGFFAVFNLASEAVVEFFSSLSIRGNENLYLFEATPAWYASGDWWWTSARVLMAIAGTATFVFALTFGPWQELGIAIVMMFLALIDRTTNHRDRFVVTVYRDNSADIILILLIFLLALGGISEPIVTRP